MLKAIKNISKIKKKDNAKEAELSVADESVNSTPPPDSQPQAKATEPAPNADQPDTAQKKSFWAKLFSPIINLFRGDKNKKKSSQAEDSDDAQQQSNDEQRASETQVSNPMNKLQGPAPDQSAPLGQAITSPLRIGDSDLLTIASNLNNGSPLLTASYSTGAQHIDFKSGETLVGKITFKPNEVVLDGLNDPRMIERSAETLTQAALAKNADNPTITFKEGDPAQLAKLSEAINAKSNGKIDIKFADPGLESQVKAFLPKTATASFDAPTQPSTPTATNPLVQTNPSNSTNQLTV